MTGLAGFAWLFYIIATGEKVSFSNESIQYQVPILCAVVIMKYLILVKNRFKTKKALFRANIYGYIVFLIVVLVIDYKDQLF